MTFGRLISSISRAASICIYRYSSSESFAFHHLRDRSHVCESLLVEAFFLCLPPADRFARHCAAAPAGAEEDALTNQAAAKIGLKQETIAIVAVGLTILGAILFTTSRLEAHIDRVQASIDRVQTETRAEARADREAFSREILRLTVEQSRFAGIIEGPRAE